MNMLHWQTSKTIRVDSYKVPCAREPEDSAFPHAIRRDSKLKGFAKRIFWPFLSCRNRIFVDGFIERVIKRWAAELISPETVFLEVGCGNMEMIKILPPELYYNGFDISLSQFHISRIMEKDGKVNIAVASATDIPLADSSVNLIISCEVFEHILDLDKAISEILRVAMPGASLLCSIPNNFCHKYKVKGPHPDHVNNFTFQGFIDYMETRGFDCKKKLMKGFWIPFPKWLVKTSCHLPVKPKTEYYCTNFFYHFKVTKQS